MFPNKITFAGTRGRNKFDMFFWNHCSALYGQATCRRNIWGTWSHGQPGGVGSTWPSLVSSLQQERPKSAVFSGEGKVKMSVEEQIDRMRRHQSGSMKEKRRSLQLPASPAPEPSARPAYKVVMSSQLPTGLSLPSVHTAALCPWPAWDRELEGETKQNLAGLLGYTPPTPTHTH